MLNMFKKLSVRIIVPIVLIVTLPIVINVINKRKSITDYTIELNTEKQRSYIKILKYRIKTSEQKALLAASICGELSYVHEAYHKYYVSKKLDSASLIIENKIDIIDKKIENITNTEALIHFHLPPATSFIRSWNKKRGDNLQSFRKSILKVNTTRQSISGIEVGKSGVVLRGITPIFDKSSNHLGSVEVIFPLVDILKSITESDNSHEYAIYISNTAKKISSDTQNKLFAEGGIGKYTKVAESKKMDYELISDINLQSDDKVNISFINNHIQSIVPITDIENRIVAYVILQTDISQALDTAHKESWTFIAMGLAVIIILSLFIYFFIDKNVIQRINSIKDSIVDISKGKIIDLIKINKRDEIGIVYESLNKLLNKFKSLSTFANEIGQGNNKARLKDVEKDDALSNSLIAMRDNIALVNKKEEARKIEDQKRNWATTGYAKFGDILRQNNGDIDKLYNIIITELVKYLKANQAGLFTINTEDNTLELKSLYAYNRLKYTENTIELGQGLIGTCAIEKQTIFLTDVPDDYVSIQSGLGEATPSSLLLVPLKIEQEVFGVVELASFDIFEKYQINFIEKVGENIASTIKSLMDSEQTKILLNKSQLLAEELSEQEEEMRQNMEELQSTQEEMMKNQHALQVSSKKTDAILNNSQDGIVLISINTQLIDTINQTLLKATGFDKNDLINNNYTKLFKYLKLDKVKDGDKKRQKVLSKYEDNFLADIYINEVTFDGEDMLLLYIRNVEHRVKMEQNLAIDLEVAEKQKRKLREQESNLKENIEEMAAQEEELRQNMEEMEATQDEMKLKQQIIEEANQKTNIILNNSQQGISIINVSNKKITTVNEAFKALTEYTEDNLLGMNYKTIFKFLKIDRIKHGDKKRQKIIKKDGSKILTDIFIVKEKINDREIIILFTKDVTEEVKQSQQIVIDLEKVVQQRKKLKAQEENLKENIEEMAAQEEELRQNMEEMQATQEEMQIKQHTIEEYSKKVDIILNNAQDGILIIDKVSQKINTVNQAILSLSNYSEQELIGSSYKIILKFLDINKIKHGDKKRQKLIRKDGSKFLADIYIIEETINEKTSTLLFIKDVTQAVNQSQQIILDLEYAEQQKKHLKEQEHLLKENIEEMASQEEELRQNMEEMQATQEEMRAKQHTIEEISKKATAILNNSLEGIVLIDKNSGKIETVNSSFIKLSNYSEKQLIGTKYNEIFKFLKLSKIKYGDKKRQKVSKKDKSTFLADIKISFEKINEKEIAILFIEDVTHEVKMQQQLVTKLEQLVKKDNK